MRSTLTIFLLFVSSAVFGQYKYDHVPILPLKNRHWFGTGQFAGSTGQYSIGAGIHWTEPNISVDARIGFSEWDRSNTIFSPSLRLVWTPLSWHLCKNITWIPIAPGVMLSAHMDDDDGFLWDEFYPRGYYWWTKSLRFHPIVQTQLAITNPRQARYGMIYAEVNTNDLYLASYIGNEDAMSITSILKLGIGIRWYFSTAPFNTRRESPLKQKIQFLIDAASRKK